jgi:hypothetical protein
MNLKCDVRKVVLLVGVSSVVIDVKSALIAQFV